MFAWGKTPLLSPGKSPFGWNPRSNAALPEADRSIWNPATAADRDDDCCGVWATGASRLWFSSSTASKLCVFGVLAIFLSIFCVSPICFKSVLKVKFSSQKYHLLWWHERSDENEEREQRQRWRKARSGARESNTTHSTPRHTALCG